MDRLHVVIAAALARCGAGLLLGLLWKIPGLIALSTIIGWGFSFVAVAIALVLIILLVYRSLSGTAVPLLMRSWLGLVNAALVVGFCVYAVL
jgi:hypothetical protein